MLSDGLRVLEEAVLMAFLPKIVFATAKLGRCMN